MCGPVGRNRGSQLGCKTLIADVPTEAIAQLDTQQVSRPTLLFLDHIILIHVAYCTAYTPVGLMCLLILFVCGCV
jgi:hypothetical protein